MNACGSQPDRVDGRGARGQPTGVRRKYFQHSPFVLRPTNKDHCWSKSTTPRQSLRCTKLSIPNGFVNMSTSYYPNLKYSILISPFSTSSLMKWYLISMCSLLHWNTRFFDNEMEEMLSQKIVVPSSFLSHKSTKILLSHIPWHAVAFATMYLASIANWEIMGCFLDSYEMTPKPIWNTYPKVLFLSSILLAQSLSI